MFDVDKHYLLLPLKDIVIFPNVESSLFVGREKSISAVQSAMQSDRKIVLFTQKETDVLVPERKDLFEVGTLCEILQLLKMPDSNYKVFLEGLHRVKLANFYNNNGEDICKVKVRPLKTVWPGKGNKVENDLLASILDKIRILVSNYDKEGGGLLLAGIFEGPSTKEKMEASLDFISNALNLPISLKQDILSMQNILERSKIIFGSLENQAELDTLERDIQERVKARMDKVQKNFYLNEQMKVIKDELGDGEKDEIENYRRKAKEKCLPKDIFEKVSQEINKIEKTPPMSAELIVVRNYLDCILDLPWSDFSEDTSDIKEAEKKLDKSHFGLEKIKERLLEYIAVRQLSKNSKSPILCFLGPPGVGKTSLARSFAESLSRKFSRIALGGLRDEAEIRGHRKTYIGALPGRIINALKRAKVKNPVILFDEIDKIGNDYRGNPAAVLLEVLDPEQNFEFIDHYLEIPFDLSQVLFIATANAAHTIPEPLLDRLELIEISGYTEQEKINIALTHLIENQIAESGISKENIEYSTKSISYIIRHYTKEAGVRQLNREFDKICRKIARQVLEHKLKDQRLKFSLNKETIQKLLGSPKYDYGKKEATAVIGKCNGLAWTSAGGDVLNIEIALAHGKGNVNITGNLGDIMKESVNTAVGYIRSKSHLLGLKPDFFEKTDIFVHVPEGAIPKDGSSAGSAAALCLVSALTQIPIRNDIALTGEITLRGMLLPIGGLREKTLAAFRGGIREVICPIKNKRDLENIPDVIVSKIKFHFLEKFNEILGVAFPGEPAIFKKAASVPYPFQSSHLPDWKNRPTVKSPH